MDDAQLELYSRAIAESFPALANRRLEYLAHGKDHVTCLVNKELVFRFPKRADAAGKLRMEISLLPELASTLPLPIPHFSYVARTPPPSFPRVFVGYRRLAGEPLRQYIPEIWDANWWPAAVGAALTALHRFPIQRAQELGVPGGTTDEWRHCYQALYSRVQERVYPLVTGSQRVAIGRYFEDFLHDPRHFRFQPVLLHGDLYSQHILLDNVRHRVTGIIDFSECRIGDPALDFRNPWEPYYTGQRDASWRERRAFYYRLQPLLEVAFSDGTAGLEDVNPQVRDEALTQLNQAWPPAGAS
ncbi:MAG TPA: phosphotransferase [Chloroflexia bacterium]|nr:phosphotransferase [Chloroflexia bacterium]